MSNSFDRFIIKEKVSSIFPFKEPLFLAIKIIILLFSILNAVGFTFILKNIDEPNAVPQALNVIIVLIVTLKDFIPTIIFPRYYLPNYLPVSLAKKFRLFAYLELINFTTIFFLLFYIITVLLNPSILVTVSEGIVGVVVANIGSALFRHLLYFNNSKKGTVISFTLSTLLLLLYLLYAGNSYPPFSCLAFELLTLAAYGLILRSVFKNRLELSRHFRIESMNLLPAFRSVKRMLFNLQLGSYGRVLAIGFLFKIIILSLNYFSFVRKGQYLFDSTFIYALFLSPLVVFSYVFNNLFGYISAGVNNIVLRSDNAKPLINLYLSSLVIPIACDFIISVWFYFLSNPLGSLFFIQYSSQLSLLIVIGMFGSLNQPIKIVDKFSFKTFYYASPLITAIGIGVILLSSTFKERLLFLTLPVIAMILFFLITRDLKKYRYIVALKFL